MRWKLLLLVFCFVLIVAADEANKRDSSIPSFALSNWQDMIMTWAKNRNVYKREPSRPAGPQSLRISADWTTSGLAHDTFAIEWNSERYTDINGWDGKNLLIPRKGEWVHRITHCRDDHTLPFEITRSIIMPPREPFYIVTYQIRNPSFSETARGKLLDLTTVDHPESSQMAWSYLNRYNHEYDLYMADLRKTGQFYYSTGAFQPVAQHQFGPSEGYESPLEQFKRSGSLTGREVFEGSHPTIGLLSEFTLYGGESAYFSFVRTLRVDWRPACDASVGALSQTAEHWKQQTARDYDAFLNKGVQPEGLTREAQQLYETSILALKNSHNPTVGTFVASFHPAYAFKVWSRDGLFSALIMSEAGYHEEALSFYRWMARAQLRGDGGFHTCYSWWNGEPIGFVEPQGDPNGAFLMGAYHAAVVHPSLPLDGLKDQVRRIENYFLNNRRYRGLVPPDYSIWEESSHPHTRKPLPLAYFTFTQSMAYGGLRAAAQLERKHWGDSWRAQQLDQRADELRRAINDNLWIESEGHYARSIWDNTKQIDARCDSSSLASVFLNVAPEDRRTRHIEAIRSNLTQRSYGLARYYDDPFFFDSQFNPGGHGLPGREVGARMPPWGVCTSFGAWAELTTGQQSVVDRRIGWLVEHSAYGQMPVGEAVDGVEGDFVWSSCPDLYEYAGVYVWTVLMKQGKAHRPDPMSW